MLDYDARAAHRYVHCRDYDKPNTVYCGEAGPDDVALGSKITYGAWIEANPKPPMKLEWCPRCMEKLGLGSPRVPDLKAQVTLN